MREFDSILIGTGQATGTLVAGLLERGEKLAVIEKDRVGGTCVNWGCTPTKTLVASARAAHVVGRAADFGIRAEFSGVDFGRVMERVNGIRNGNSESLRSWLVDKTTFYEGAARFTGPTSVEVGSETLSAKRIYVHTGARARVPSIPGLEDVPCLDNKGILALTELPEHLIIVGGSYIGLEFGQAFRRLGSSVTVIEHGERIMLREDEDIAEQATSILTDAGIRILCDSSITRLSRKGSGVNVALETPDGEQTVSGTHLLLATGRVPNSDELNLESAGIETDDRGFIVVDDHLATSNPAVFAIGDVNGKGAFTHTSVNDGQIILNNLEGGDWKVSDRTMIYAMFIDPPLGRVGMDETRARASDRKMLMGTMPMDRVSRAREKSETDGMMKVIVDAETKRITGATVFGVGGDEIINGIAAWMQSGLPYTEFQRTVMVHPTVAELVPWIFEDLQPVS